MIFKMNGMPNMPHMPKNDGCSAAMMNMQFHQNINDPLLFSSIYTCSIFWYIILCLAVALLGIHLSHHQLQYLQQFSGITLILDGDEAGILASHKISHLLKQKTRSKIDCVNLPHNLDPDDMNDTDLFHAVQSILH